MAVMYQIHPPDVRNLVGYQRQSRDWKLFDGSMIISSIRDEHGKDRFSGRMRKLLVPLEVPGVLV